MKTRQTLFTIFFFLLFAICSCSKEIKGSGKSKSEGSVSNGKLVNGRRMPFHGDNYKYYSQASYYLLNRAWLHGTVTNILVESYKECESTCPERKFLLMECSRKNGGEMWPHRTHQNGTSVDFGTPLIKNGKPYHLHNRFGLWHYTMSFDKDGNTKYNKNIRIDFNTMAKHILALDKVARKHKMYVKKVIFKIDLKDNFFASEYGKKVKKKKIYFAQSLPKKIDEQHDDHYHVDFGWLK